MENVIVDKIKLLLLREQSKQQGIGTQWGHRNISS